MKQLSIFLTLIYGYSFAVNAQDYLDVHQKAMVVDTHNEFGNKEKLAAVYFLASCGCISFS